MRSNEGQLIVISGPSGVGKGTLVGKILRRVPDVFLSISATTRKPRANEVSGVDYHFIDNRTFLEGIESGSFLEWAQIYGDFYGTPLLPIEEAVAAGRPAILEIDVQGAMKVKNRIGDKAVYIFIAPPTFEELRRRLAERKSESAAAFKARMHLAEKEINAAAEYDHVIVNDDLDKAADELYDIVNKVLRGRTK